jgi:uncharacterized membrane protein
MKKALLMIVFAAALILALPSRAVAESIKDFTATYNLQKSGLIEVTEEITYDFGLEYRHGIYRYIPYKYALDNGKTAYLSISNVSVTDNSGSSYQYEKYQENNNVVFKVGDPNRTITGSHLYRISYTVKGGLRYLDSGDEFFWNVSGTGWGVEIEKISATVKLPEEIGSEGVRVNCYRGGYRSTDKCLRSEIIGRTATFADSNLESDQNLTVVVGVPTGIFEKIDAGVAGSGISGNLFVALLLAAIAIPVLTIIYMLRHWWHHGRDPKGRGTIIAEYSAPDGLTAIEVGTLLDNRVDNKDLSAEIIYLATKGYLKIRREPGKGLFKKEDYTLTRLDGGQGAEAGFDATLITGLFGDAKEVKLSDLKDKFYEHIASIKTQVQDKLVADGYFKEFPLKTIGKYIGIAVAYGFVGFWIGRGIGMVTNGLGTYLFVPSFISSAIIVALFGLAMPARTAKGVEVKERILGLKEYMKVAESDRIKFHNAPKKDSKKFEELLPFAMALGVEKEWAAQFENIYNGKPDWYDDPTGMRFMPIVFTNNLNNFTAIATQNMASTPSSSGSGFGGGGFSGGGFGGGGGGSW